VPPPGAFNPPSQIPLPQLPTAINLPPGL
jgi:hypothetical protein